jgi:hypothetical protein
MATNELNFKPFWIPPESYFQVDVMQQRLLQDYLRKDSKFRRCYFTNYTPTFLQYLRDKARLREPISISVLGGTRTGKSTASTTLCAFMQHQYQKKFTINHILENEYAIAEAIKYISHNESFLVDESKQSVYGSGSHAHQSKLKDIQNIIAVNCVNLVSLRPDKFTNELNASYGLRTFGRCSYVCNKCKTQLELEAGRIEWDKKDKKFVLKKEKVCPKCGETKDFNPRMTRFMLYNLMESRGSNYTPNGMIYLPHFADILEYGEKLEREYLSKKQAWVEREQFGEADVLQNVKLKTAINLAKDPKIKEMRKKQEVFVYLSSKLGSEYTANEVREIQIMVSLVQRGILSEKELQK